MSHGFFNDINSYDETDKYGFLVMSTLDSLNRIVKYSGKISWQVDNNAKTIIIKKSLDVYQAK